MIWKNPRLWRVAFVLYAVALFVATHKPGVHVNVVPGWRLDLIIHVGAFGAWTFLLGMTGWFDPRHWRGASALLTIGVCYALLDEGSQAIPIFERVFDVADALANVVGALLGVAAVTMIVRWMDPPRKPRP